MVWCYRDQISYFNVLFLCYQLQSIRAQVYVAVLRSELKSFERNVAMLPFGVYLDRS